jgi:NAD(P)H-dependent flavin oxidoreductase YrpB (nitropropane dioxygenase family)
MLGIEFPICAFSHCRDVVAAVTNAGGFGVLGAVAHSPERLQNELTWIEEQTGGKPYGVDLLLPPKYVGAEQGGIDAEQARTLMPEEHRAFVDDLLAATASRRPPASRVRLPAASTSRPRATNRCSMWPSHTTCA